LPANVVIPLLVKNMQREAMLRTLRSFSNTDKSFHKITN